METTELRNIAENIIVENVIRKDGIYNTEQGNSIPYKNYTIVFTIGNSPLKIKAKVDKVFNDYIEDIE